jgi:FkbM family methyltransferase
MTFFKRVVSNIKRKLGFPEPLATITIWEQELLLRGSSIRMKPDYDDAWVLACALRAETIFDIGANVGYDSLIMLLKNQKCRIALIEANPEALTIASENLIRNHLSSRAHFISSFLGKNDDENIEFWTLGAGAAGSAYKSHAHSAAKSGTYIQVPSQKLDTLCKNLNIIPDFIKIDVEGAEYDVLSGAQQTASNHKIRILIEMHSNPDLSMLNNARNILGWADKMNYSCWYLKKHTLLAKPEEIEHRGRCHILLQPREWAYPDWLKTIGQADPLDKALN